MVHRIRSAPLEDQTILFGKSRIRKHPPVSIDRKMVEKILENRDQPPQGLGRIPGPLPILYYFQKDTELKTSNCRLPRSTRTIWKVLTQYQRIHYPVMSIAEPEERPDPGVEWGLDFHDVSMVPSDPDGKQQHVVEILNLVDHGSSSVVASEPVGDYNAKTAFRKVANVLVAQGCPDRIRLDRNTRWVGSWTARDFPSPMLHFLQCLGIEPQVCPPRRPDKNPFVERYHRNFKYECQLIERPTDLQTTMEANQRYVHFYNYERPNHRSCRENRRQAGARRQAITCGNQPPFAKFPTPPTLTPVPPTIESGLFFDHPDRWLL